MTKAEILNQVQDILRDIFDDEDIIVTENTVADDIEDWDSLEHINVITSIEKHFNIKFAMSEVTGFKNVGNMVDTILNKLS